MRPDPTIRIIGPRWRLLVEGDARAIELEPWNRKGLDYLLGRLFEGEPVALSALAHYGIRVRHLGDEVEIIVVPPL